MVNTERGEEEPVSIMKGFKSEGLYQTSDLNYSLSAFRIANKFVINNSCLA
jgi:hypothetical protein